MAKKVKKIYHTYKENGDTFMICKSCQQDYCKVTDEDVVAVTCGLWNAKRIPWPEMKKAYVPTGRPAGWQWMNEFVDKDGTVYHKGVEQPKLKGTLPPTNVDKIKSQHKANRSAKKITENKQLLKHAAKKKAAKKEVEEAFAKQKEFLNGHSK